MAKIVYRVPIEMRRYVFYVDATGGNDGNDGRTSSTAWQTETAVNAADLEFGDTVLFKRGETWLLSAAVNGVSGVTYGAYGSGANPVLNGQDTVNCFTATNKTGIRLENLELYNGVGYGAGFITCTRCYVKDCVCHNAGNDNLIFITNCRGCVVSGGEFYDSRNVGGSTQSCGIEIADGCVNIIVDGAKCYNNNQVGLSIHNHDYGGGNTTQMPTGIFIRNVEVYGNLLYGFLYLNQSPTVGENIGSVYYEDCNVHDNTAHGLYVVKTAPVSYYPSEATFTNCVFLDNGQYAAYLQADDLIFNRCVFANGRIVRLVSFSNISFNNCTFYNTTWAGYALISMLNSDSRVVGPLTVRNCIFGSPDSGQYMIHNASAGGAPSSATIDYNRYQVAGASNRWAWNGVLQNFAAWQAACGDDSNSAAGTDSLLTNPAADDYTLQTGSPAIDAGIEITGVTDGYLGLAPDCGAYEKE